MASSKRFLDDWIKGFLRYVEDTEAPREFWQWGCIFMICAALQRRVWLPYGLEPIYPNLFVLIVAPPGEARKGHIPGEAKKFLQEVGIPVSVDSSSKRALTQELAELYKTCHYTLNGKTKVQTPLAIISKEMSSLLSVDPKGMIEVLTDLYDSHEVWKYKTAGQGEDNLYGVCVSCLIATTPTWLAANLPDEAIGGGYTSRHVIVYGDQRDRYKHVSIPPAPNEKIKRALLHDLSIISMLAGEFVWGKGAQEVFDKWYKTLPDRRQELKDRRLHGYMARIHVIALKVAMARRVSYTSDLTIDIADLEFAFHILDKALERASDALGGHGSSKSAVTVERVLKQIYNNKGITYSDLLSYNFRDASKPEMDEILATCTGMGSVKEIVDEKGNKHYEYTGRK